MLKDHLPCPMSPTTMYFNLIYTQHASQIWVLSEYESTAMFCFVFLLLKYAHIPLSSTYLRVWEYLSLWHFPNWSKIPSRICPENSFTPQITHGHEKTQFQTDLSKCCLESVPLNKKTELIPKGSPASYSGREDRITAATQTFPLTSLLSGLGQRGSQESPAFLCSACSTQLRSKRGWG